MIFVVVVLVGGAAVGTVDAAGVAVGVAPLGAMEAGPEDLLVAVGVVEEEVAPCQGCFLLFGVPVPVPVVVVVVLD